MRKLALALVTWHAAPVMLGRRPYVMAWDIGLLPFLSAPLSTSTGVASIPATRIASSQPATA